MSLQFSARYSISYIEDINNGNWRITGKIYDDSLIGYLADAVQIGDAIFDENPDTGIVNRWKITQIVSVSIRNLVCIVSWDDEGDPDLLGPQYCEAAICRTSSVHKISEIPTILFTKVTESIQTRIHNINNRVFIDTSITSGTSGTSGLDGTSGTSGINGDAGTSGTSGIGFKNKEQWLNETSYLINDIVKNINNIYCCILSHTSSTTLNEPGTGTDWQTYWILWVESGTSFVWQGDWT